MALPRYDLVTGGIVVGRVEDPVAGAQMRIKMPALLVNHLEEVDLVAEAADLSEVEDRYLYHALIFSYVFEILYLLCESQSSHTPISRDIRSTLGIDYISRDTHLCESLLCPARYITYSRRVPYTQYERHIHDDHDLCFWHTYRNYQRIYSSPPSST